MHTIAAGTRRLLLAIILTFVGGALASAPASAETRTLKLYYVHTKERAEITFKRNGRYVNLDKVNRFLRDWRRNEPTRMDPKLLDLVWEVYRKSGARDYIHVVSAYRSPATNAMLRRTRGGQAEKSQHMVGKALDFYIPGVKLATLRANAMKLQGGGVGYYPKSGSPFVHLDTGGVRAWPRMSRQELARLFPDGKTLHLPPDGKPLPGYQQALAMYKAKGRVSTPVAGGDSERGSDGKPRRTLLAALFGGGADEEEETSPEFTKPAPEPARPARNTRETLPGVEAAPQAEPAQRAAPEPEPEVVVASLPSARNAPIPVAAPRRAGAASAPTPPAEIPAEPAAEPETTVAFAAPVPAGRPEDAVDAAAAGVRPEADAQRAALMAAIEADAPTAETGAADLRVPLPSNRPRRPGETQVAAASPVDGDEPDLPGSLERDPVRGSLEVAFAPPTVRDRPGDSPFRAAINPASKGDKAFATGSIPVPQKAARVSRPAEPEPVEETAALAPAEIAPPGADVDSSRFGGPEATDPSAEALKAALARAATTRKAETGNADAPRPLVVDINFESRFEGRSNLVDAN